MNRHRSQGWGMVPLPYDNRHYTYNVSTKTYQWSSVIHQPGFSYENSGQSIDDDYEPYGIGIWGFKPCIRQKYEFTPSLELASERSNPVLDTTRWWITEFNPGGSLAVMNPGNFTSLSCHDVFPVWPDFPESAEEVLRGKWDRDMVPKIKQEVDLLVALLEIRQTLAMLKSYASAILEMIKPENLPEQLYANCPGIRVALSESARSLTYNLSNKWLELNFGWKPLISDLMGCLKSILHYRSQLEDLLIGEGKIHTAHGSYTDPNEPWSVRSGGSSCSMCGNTCVGNPNSASHPWEMRYPNSVNWKYGLTVKYSYTLPAWCRGMEGAIRSLFSSLGISPGLDVLWEIIPFSFVLDWIYPVGQILAKATIDPCPVKVTVKDVVISRKAGAQAEIWAAQRLCGGLKKQAEATYSYYERKVDPNFLDFDLPSFRWPNLFQLSLGIALGFTKFKRWGKGA